MAEGRSSKRQAAKAPGATPMVKAGRTAACLVALAVLGTSGFAWYTVGNLDGVNTSNALDAAKKDAPKHLDSSINILLIGLDSRKDQDGNDLPKEFVSDELHAGSSEIGGYNTNSMIVLHIPPNGKAQAVSIPRDDWVQTYGADGKMHKLKEAYGIAKDMAESKLRAQGVKGADLEHKSRDAGRSATIQSIQHLLNIPIDHFAEVNLLGFYDIAKALQPITVCLNHPVNDPIVSRVTDSKGNVIKPGGGTGLKLPAGQSQVDAATALSFVRQRHNLAGGDLDRTHRQQAFIASVEYKLKQEGIFGDLGKMQSLFDVVKKDIVIDNQWNLLDFAQQAPNLTGGNVEFNTLPIDAFGNRDGQDVNIVDPAKLQRIVQQVFGHDPAPAPSGSDQASASAAPAAQLSGTVDVYNASKTADSSAEMQALTAMGLKPGKTLPSSSKSKTVEVLYGTGAKDAANSVAGHYNVPAKSSSTVAAGHIEVILGTGYTSAGAAAPAAGQSAPAQGGDQSASADPAAGVQMQGKAVQGGGVPCVD